MISPQAKLQLTHYQPFDVEDVPPPDGFVIVQFRMADGSVAHEMRTAIAFYFEGCPDNGVEPQHGSTMCPDCMDQGWATDYEFTVVLPLAYYSPGGF